MAAKSTPGLGLPPAATLIAAVLIMLLISVATPYQVKQQVWIGARFSPPHDSTIGIVVKSVDPNSPAAAVLTVGQKLVAISDGANSVPLDPVILEAPNNLPTYELFNRSVAVQNDIWRVLQNEEVRFQTDTNEWLTVHPQPEWPPRAISRPYWSYSILSSIGVLFGLLVWTRNPKALSSAFMLLVVCLIFLTLNVTILLDRELAHPALYMRTVSALENFGTNLIFSAYMGLFLIYPKRLARPKVALAIPIIAMLIPLNSTIQWLEIPVHAYMFHFLFTATIMLMIFYLQWRASRKSPVDRSLLKLTFLWMAIPFSLSFFLFMVPESLGLNPVLDLDSARLGVCGAGIGLALGILVHGLIDVDRWLVYTFLWLGGGALVILLDLSFASLLHIEPVSTLTAALIIAGLAYFPLRQLLLTKFLPDQGIPLQKLLPEFATLMRGAAAPADFEQRWTQILKTRFQPAATRTGTKPASGGVLLSESRLALLVPTLDGRRQLILSGKNDGAQLFNKRDVEFVNSLLLLTRTLLHASNTRRHAKIQERSRIMADLQATLGKKIRSLVVDAPGDDERVCAQNALSTLNDTVHFSAQKDPIAFSELIDTWRREFMERLKGARVQPRWESQLTEGVNQLSPMKSMILTNILRESITNALKHANPRTIIVRIAATPRKLIVTVSNDGDITDPENWNPCFGLSGMRSRIQSVGGEVQVKKHEDSDQNFVQIKALMPID